MRRTVIFTIIIMFAACVGYLAFAGEPACVKDMAGKGMMCPMHSMMCGHMMQKQIVAVEDGGVVVMCCNKLFKYDKNLNLVKEAELKVEAECKNTMGKMMKECSEKCMMMKTEKPAGDKM